MVKQVCKYGILACFVLTAGIGTAQSPALPAEEPQWQISGAEGGIVLNRGGSKTVYRNSREAVGILLGPLDMIQTGSGKAELSIASVSGSPVILNLGDNTSVQILEQGSPAFELFYGRIKIRTDRPIQFRYGNALLVVEGESACDYIARPGITQMLLTVHCFSGQGELIPQNGADAPKIPVKAQESLSLEYRVPFMYVERRHIDPLAVQYWNAGFIKEDGIREEIPAVQAPVEMRYTPEGWEQTKKIKNGYIITGLILMGAGTAMQGYSHFGSPGQDAGNGLFYGGYGALGLGAVFLLGGALHNP